MAEALAATVAVALAEAVDMAGCAAGAGAELDLLPSAQVLGQTLLALAAALDC
eukprot:CAMPEP_0181129068 /NCGR_PEP_ID=MMETSP1071-20121207/29124_1 /TAXON_ID=35127 /ORGANISM="Thalassiosira sp., Strain NH16" /LENGTH=52 /DNA_ID=CAMNT_0023215029 /DNA_START=582 /DNA_END=741 /DNA_ORIENTATION=-